VKNYREDIGKLFEYYDKYLQGKDKALKLTLITFLSRGHLLIEDVPGLGKTTLALAIAKSMGLSFGRIQCTNDLLPTDITGLSIFNKDKRSFEFRKGPIFNNIVLVDEINRATPKTQSALLESMGEKQVTVEGETYQLPNPFFVIATQNPSEQHGTFPLPESQLDRFLMKISIGYPSRKKELEILKRGSNRSGINKSESVLSSESVLNLISFIKNTVSVDDKIYEYLLEIANLTRENSEFLIGLSTRAMLSILNAAKVSAFINDRDFVIPEDISDYLRYTVSHRVLFRKQLPEDEKADILKSLLDSIRLPV